MSLDCKSPFVASPGLQLVIRVRGGLAVLEPVLLPGFCFVASSVNAWAIVCPPHPSSNFMISGINAIPTARCHFHHSLGCLSQRDLRKQSTATGHSTRRRPSRSWRRIRQRHRHGGVKRAQTECPVINRNALMPSCNIGSFALDTSRRLPWRALCGGSDSGVCCSYVPASVTNNNKLYQLRFSEFRG